MKTIGIIGGLGPRATSEFHNLLISICEKKYNAIQDSDYPPIIIYEVPIKGFDQKGIDNNKKVLEALKKGITTLENANVDFIVIDCNTVHLFIDALRKSTKIPILSIMEEIVKIVKLKYKKVGLLGSQTTIEKGLYDKYLTEIEIIHPTAVQEEKITKIILKVMGGTNTKDEKNEIQSIIREMKSKGAEAIIIGCTELSIVVKHELFDIPIIDSSEVLANKTVDYAYSNQ